MACGRGPREHRFPSTRLKWRLLLLRGANSVNDEQQHRSDLRPQRLRHVRDAGTVVAVGACGERARHAPAVGWVPVPRPQDRGPSRGVVPQAAEDATFTGQVLPSSRSVRRSTIESAISPLRTAMFDSRDDDRPWLCSVPPWR